jgi:pimeloyl-ACP methyl ester carboxylesterase
MAGLGVGCRVRAFEDAGHWIHHDAPETVNKLLVEFLAES